MRTEVDMTITLLRMARCLLIALVLEGCGETIDPQEEQAGGERDAGANMSVGTSSTASPASHDRYIASGDYGHVDWQVFNQDGGWQSGEIGVIGYSKSVIVLNYIIWQCDASGENCPNLAAGYGLIPPETSKEMSWQG